MKKAFLTIFLALAFFCGGCLQLEQIFTLKKDGSMIVSMTYSIPVSRLSALKAGHEAITSWQNAQDAQKHPVNWFLDEKAVRSFFSKPEDKMEVIVYRQFQRDGRQFAQIVVSAKNAARAFEQGYFGDMKLRNNVLTVHFPSSLNDLPKEDIANLRRQCEDLSVSVEVIPPHAIKETNGYKRKDDHAVWLFSADGRGIDIFGKINDLTVSW